MKYWITKGLSETPLYLFERYDGFSVGQY